MENVDWDKMFHDMVDEEGIESDNKLEKELLDLDRFQVQRTITGMNECSTYLGRYLLQCMESGDIRLPSKIHVLLQGIVDLTGEISEVLSECNCDICREADEEDYDDEDAEIDEEDI